MTPVPSIFKTPSTWKPTLLNILWDTVSLIENLCGHSPLPFSIVALFGVAGSYFIRYYRDDLTSKPLSSALLMLLTYYTLVAAYRHFVYNRYFDPLLALPGPKVPPSFIDLSQGHWLHGVAHVRFTDNVHTTKVNLMVGYSSRT